jgi:hypothetical protein
MSAPPPQMCTTCKRRPSAPQRKTCERCLERYRRYRESPKGRDTRERYWQSPAGRAFKQSEECRTYQREYKRRYRAAKKAARELEP